MPLPTGAQWPPHLLVGWVAGALASCVPTLWRVRHLDAPATASLFDGADGGPTETDVIVVIAALASLGAAALMLAGGGSGTASSRVYEGVLTVLAVGTGWVAVHTVYTLRYARHHLVNEPGCVDFNGDDEPRLTDFAYLSFTLGMTYQVSDTALRTPEVAGSCCGTRCSPTSSAPSSWRRRSTSSSASPAAQAAEPPPPGCRAGSAPEG